MPTSSDPFDIDDDLFANPDALDSLEAHALQSTQTPAPAPNPGPSQPRKRTTQPYHHQIARPSQTFSGRKEPAPLNTEPRAGNSGFGWEFGGKRSIDGNVERHIAAIGERAAYWSHGKERREEEEYPDVVVGKNGKYEFGQDMEDEGEEVVDNHARMGMGLGTSQSQVRDPKGAAARREAIAAASASAGQTTTIFVRPPLSRSNSASSSPNITRQAAAGPSNPPPPPQPPQKFAQRSLSRSVSAGSHPVSRPPSRINPLPPIASQSSQSSQGSATRRVAIELEEERRKREATEAQLKALQNQLLVEKNRIQESRKERETESLGDDPENWMKELQAELYKAKGEAETMRRAQKDEQARLAAEADKLRARISNMEVELQARKRDSARVVESVKTQAIFNNHAVHNSAARARASSQRPGPSSQARPAPTPMRNGSPQGKGVFGDGEGMLTRSVKGKGKEVPPALKFNHLNNAFQTPITVSRVKRARTEAMSPARSPGPSPTKARVQAAPRSWPVAEVFEEPVEGVMDVQWFPGLEGDEVMPLEEVEEVDHKAELLYHLFNHVPLSPLQYALDPQLVAQPTIYRMLNYRPPPHLDATSSYAKACGDLLRAFGDADLGYEGLSDILARTGITLLEILVPSLAQVEAITPSDVAALINVLTLLSTAAWLFPPLIIPFTNLDLDIGGLLKFTVNRVFADQATLERLKEKISMPDWPRELAERVADLAGAICWFGDGSLWKGDGLVDLILGLTATHLDVRTVRKGMEVAWSAACYKSNFRAVLGSSERWPGDQPVLERIGRYLISPHPGADEKETLRHTTTLIRAISMLSIASPEAVILVAERSLVVPALILVLQRESTKVWGVHADLEDPVSALNIIHPALALLHHLVYPMPLSKISTASSQTAKQLGPDPEPDPIDGINLAARLQSATMQKEFNGLAHVFVSCLGAMAYAHPDLAPEVEKESGRWGGGDITSLQYLAQDLLESVVEGPEGDAIFEIYEEVEEPLAEAATGKGKGRGQGKADAGAEVADEDMLEAMAMEIGDDFME